MRTFLRLFVAVALACVVLPALAQDDAGQPTLAEQAARARATKTSDLDTRVAGRVVDGVYRNEFLGFEVHALPQWDVLNRGEMNVNEAVGREYLGMKAGVDTNVTGRVFGMRDGRGQSVTVGMKLILAQSEVEDIPKQIETAFRRAFPGIQVTRETAVLLGDSAHRFDGVRLVYTVAGHDIVQSLQYTIWKNYLITFTSTSTTPEHMTALLKELRPRVTWLATPGGAAPPPSAPVRTPPPSAPSN